MKNVKASIYGYVVGDVLGLPLKNKTREKLLKKPVDELIKINGFYDIGYYSINVSFIIASIESIIDNDIKINYKDIMNKYLECVNSNKYLSDRKFNKDVDKTTINALLKFKDSESIDNLGSKKYEDNNNKGLSRMLPIILYSYYKRLEDDEIYSLVKKYSSLTHAHQLSIMASFIYVKYVLNIMKGKDKNKSYELIKCVDYNKYFRKEVVDEFSRLLKENINELKLDDIQSSDNVVDTLEAVIWVLLNTNSYKQAIIGSSNLGGDTHTISGLVGGVAGIIYGVDNIPSDWLDNIKKKELINNTILNLVMKLY